MLPDIVSKLQDRTLGNPFFVHTYLHFLVQSDLLSFHEKDRCWRLDRTQIDCSHPDDVVSWYAKRLESLDDATRSLISLSACLGHSFDAATLSIINETSVEESEQMLASAQCSQFIVSDVEPSTNHKRSIKEGQSRRATHVISLEQKLRNPKLLQYRIFNTPPQTNPLSHRLPSEAWAIDHKVNGLSFLNQDQ